VLDCSTYRQIGSGPSVRQSKEGDPLLTQADQQRIYANGHASAIAADNIGTTAHDWTKIRVHGETYSGYGAGAVEGAVNESRLAPEQWESAVCTISG
jgi:hypothetical protein